MSGLFTDYVFPKKKIRLIEFFAGIGSQAMALRDIGADFENWFICEFDIHAVKSYNAIHGTNFEPCDIRNIHGADLRITDKQNYNYILTYSFPCQDLSSAGKRKGMKKGEGTRSGLLWEVERILKELPYESLPDVLLMENVSAVHNKKNISDFNSWIDFLAGIGYCNFYADLNACDYGIPQNRLRCFMVSILSNDFINFTFPSSIPLEKKMADYLEESVDDRYYVKNERAEALLKKMIEEGCI